MSIKRLLGVAMIFLVTQVYAGKFLIYKWKLNGREIAAEDTESETVLKGMVRQKGFLILEYDDENNSFTDSVLIKVWKETGQKMFFYTIEDFMNGDAEFTAKKTEKGDIIEITAVGENFYGDIKNGIDLKEIGQFSVPAKFKGNATWKCIFDSGKVSVGEAKTSLSIDKKKTMLVNTMDFSTDPLSSGAESDDKTELEKDLKDLKTKLDFVANDKFLSMLFNSKPCDYRRADYGRSIYGSTTFLSSGLFQYLAVGTEDDFYAFPESDGKNGEVLRTDGKGNLYWGEIGSRDEYLLNRANHYGYQSASTISDFAETVYALLKGELDQDIINNINSDIDMATFLQELNKYLKENTENVFNEYLTKNLDATTIISNMDAADITEIVKKLQKDSTFNSLIDPTKIISDMDASDLTALKINLRLDNVENIKNNFTATTAPTANDDATKGYSIGSFWLDQTNRKAYQCLISTAGAAEWLDLSSVTTVTAANVTGLDDAISNNEKIKHLTVTKDVDLDKLSQITIDADDTVNLSNMKAAIGAILDYMHNSMGVNPQIYDKDKL